MPYLIRYNHRNLLVAIVCIVMFPLILILGCSSGEKAPAEPTETQIIHESTAKPIPVLPHSGHWEGDPKVSLDISGNALSIEMTAPLGKGSTCTISTSVTLKGLFFRTLSISGTFSDQENVSGEYTIVMCGGLLPTPVSGKWNAHLVDGGS
jgi:hypothetical protein